MYRQLHISGLILLNKLKWNFITHKTWLFKDKECLKTEKSKQLHQQSDKRNKGKTEFITKRSLDN